MENYFTNDKDYKYLYLKYKKKYLLKKHIILKGSASINRIPKVPANILLTRQSITKPVQLDLKDDLSNGEIWIFNSNLSREGRDCDSKNIYKTGHLALSFDTKDLSDKDKKIYGFGPKSNKWINGCVEGSVKDDTQYFIDFYNKCSNIRDPLYKINIKYDPIKIKYFMETSSTYSDPIMGDKIFDLKFSNKSEYNNCITYVINNIEPLIQINENLYIIIQSEYIDGIGMYPGGWISEFISTYSKYGSNIFKKSYT